MRFYNFVTDEWKEATEWQSTLKPGDYYFIDNYQIYGQILESTGEPGFFWVEAYSVACPRGETGSFCVIDATRQLTAEEFEQAKQHGWRIESSNS